MNIKQVLMTLTIILFLSYLTVSDAEENSPTNAYWGEENRKSTKFENSECAENIYAFTNTENIWDITFIYQPEKVCVVLKDNIWYDLNDDNKIIMKQKL